MKEAADQQDSTGELPEPSRDDVKVGPDGLISLSLSQINEALGK